MDEFKIVMQLIKEVGISAAIIGFYIYKDLKYGKETAALHGKVTDMMKANEEAQKATKEAMQLLHQQQGKISMDIALIKSNMGVVG
jgi:hypothetical protein